MYHVYVSPWELLQKNTFQDKNINVPSIHSNNWTLAQIQIYKEHVLGVKNDMFEQDTYIGD